MANESIPSIRGDSRVFIIKYQAGPEHVPDFMDWAAAGGVEQSVGDSTRIEVPSVTEYGAYDVVGEIPGAVENATISIMFQDRHSLSTILDLARRRCPLDLQIHVGRCKDPRDFDGGWDKIRVLEAARVTKYATDEEGSLASGDNDKVTETDDFSALNFYEIVPLTYAARAGNSVTSEVKVVVVCDKPSCGECGEPSSGCEKVYAVLGPAGSSPGLKPSVVYSDDGLTSDAVSSITTFDVGNDPFDADCVGTNLVVTDPTGLLLHYADLEDILDGTAVWASTATGLVAAKGPQGIDSYSPRDTWIVGKGGYIYFTTDPTNGVTVQDAGVATTQDLNAVFAFSINLVVAVGNSNAVVFTENGGDAWSSVTGPVPGVNLLSIAVRTESEWWVGANNGKLYYTIDKGSHWTEKTFPGSGSGSVRDIVWASDTVGYLAHKTTTPTGRILRTISGGYSWYVAPEGQATMPAGGGFNSLAVCIKEPNVVYAGGLATGGIDGILVKGS